MQFPCIACGSGHLSLHSQIVLLRSGEVVEDVAPPLPLATPLLLVKPPAGLATPAVFRALDLGGRSAADPGALLAALASDGPGAALPFESTASFYVPMRVAHLLLCKRPFD